MGGRGASSKTSSLGSSKQMSSINTLFNKEISKFNSYQKEFKQGSDKQQKVTKQVKGLEKIYTSGLNAKKSWEFSNNIDKVYHEVKKTINNTKFSKPPKGALTKESKEYRERRANGEKPKSVYTGIKDSTFNQLSLAVNSQNFGGRPDELKRRLLKKVNYYKP